MYYIKNGVEDEEKAGVDKEVSSFHIAMLLDGASEKEKTEFLELIRKKQQ